MRRRGSSLLTLALLLGGLPGCGPTDREARVTSPEDMVAVSRAMVTLDRLASEGDIDALAARFAEDALVMPPERPTALGRRVIRERAAKLLGEGGLEIEHEPLEVDAAGAYLIHRGILHVRRDTTVRGTSRDLDLRYLYVLKRAGEDSLLVWRAIFNRASR